MNPRQTSTPRYRGCDAFCALLPVFLIGGLTSAQQPEHGPPAQQEPSDIHPEPQPPAAKFVIVEGQITDDIGAGQEGVTVTVRRKREGVSEGEIIAMGTTDKLGDFAVTAWEPVRGDVVITAWAPFFTTLTRELHLGDEERPPFIAETLEGKILVIGRVVNALTSQPLADASVQLTSRYREWRESTDDQGRFTIKGVPPGRGEFVVEAEHYGRERQPVAKLEDFGEVVIRLKPERIVHIKTVDELGNPIAGVTVECLDPPRDDFRTSVTDPNGMVTLRGLHFDVRALGCRLTHPDHVSNEDFDREIVPPENEVESSHELVMIRAGGISGRVTDTGTGDPINGARVMTGDGPSDRTPRDWADHLGQYTIRGVKPGPAVVTVHCPGNAPELKTVEVTAGETSTLDIELAPGGFVKGSVKRETGEPVSAACVDATTWRGHATLGLRAVTEQDGRFVIKDAPLDGFEVTVTAVGFDTVTRTIKAGGSDVEITLPAMAAETVDTPHSAWLNVGDTAPVLKLTTLAGETLNFADLRGKAVLLHFWAVSCPPCLEDLPHLLSVRDKYRPRRDFAIVGVSLDGDEQPVRDFITKSKMDWPQAFGDTAGAKSAAGRYGVRAPPAVFLIDPHGKLIGVNLRGAEIKSKVEQVLKEYDPP
jgi:peroxiredoxin